MRTATRTRRCSSDRAMDTHPAMQEMEIALPHLQQQQQPLANLSRQQHGQQNLGVQDWVSGAVRQVCIFCMLSTFGAGHFRNVLNL